MHIPYYVPYICSVLSISPYIPIRSSFSPLQIHYLPQWTHDVFIRFPAEKSRRFSDVFPWRSRHFSPRFSHDDPSPGSRWNARRGSKLRCGGTVSKAGSGGGGWQKTCRGWGPVGWWCNVPILMTFIEDLPINNGDFPSFFVCLPEYNNNTLTIWLV